MTIPSPRARRRARIEIIPLIDIFFFLLATFVMVSLSMVKNRGIPVHLPAAATGAPQDSAEVTTITVTANGGIFFNKEPVPPDALTARLQRLKSEQPDAKIFLNGDEKAYFGDTMRVLDELRALGLTHVAVQTKPPS